MSDKIEITVKVNGENVPLFTLSDETIAKIKVQEKPICKEGWHIHPNGGGLVQDTAFVDPSVFVGKDARVSGKARVYGNARVYDTAHVYGDARVSGNAEVYGDARVYDGYIH